MRMTLALCADYSLKVNYRLIQQNGYLSAIKVKKRYRIYGDPHPKKNALVRKFSISCSFDKMAKYTHIGSEGSPH